MRGVGDVVALPATGVTITLPGAPAGWAVSVVTDDREAAAATTIDVLRRQDPTNPVLEIDLERARLGSCADVARELDRIPGVVRSQPSPLAPTPWAPWSYELPTTVARLAPGQSAARVCADTKAGPLTATLVYDGPLSSLDPMIATPLLSEVGRVAGATRAESAPKPAPPAPKAPASAEPPRDDDDDDDDAPREKGVHGAYDLGVLHFVPRDGGDAPIVGWFGLDVSSASNFKGRVTSTLGTAVDLGVGIGLGTRKTIPWDVHVGVGPSIAIGPVLLVPRVGLGADGVAGPDDAFHLKSAAYYDYGGRLRVRLSRSMVLGATATLLRRGAREIEVDNELRLWSSLVFGDYAIGVRYTRYGDDFGRMLGAIFGFAF